MQIDEPAIDAAAAESGFTGVVAIDGGDQRLFERCCGFANRAAGVPNTADTRFALASGSKTFTALAVWKPTDYVLTVPVHELAETSGFPPMLAGRPQKYAPGERFGYCNQGFVVLALVIERVAGTGFHEFVQTQVFDPAGLTRTGFLRSDDLPRNAALGYFEKTGNHTNVLHLPVRGNGDGGAYSTVGDLHRFWQAVLAGRIAGPDLVAEVIRPRNDVPEEGMRYAAGLWLHATGPQLIMAGYDAGVSMRSVHDPASGTTVTVLSNSSQGAGPVINLVQGLFD